ncbi:MAG: hypothetical protein Q4G14_02155 [Paracoccus sp. (in: a-proteobacteria)]|nr:hypothetical protein [Paracoccus sp. (in: a-proteobacteria)]
MATRFGATAIIIVAWFPLAQLAPELHKAAWVYALPEVTSQIWVVWVLLVLAVVMTPLALASMLSVIAPLYRYLEGSKGIWKIAASAVALALTVCAYAALLVVIAMGTEFSDEATKLARQLSVQDQACADPPLHGQVCEDAINALLAK